MRLPLSISPVQRQARIEGRIVSEIAPSWNCNSKCKRWQLDCKAWKELFCTQQGAFARCMGFPNEKEAAGCLAAVKACSVAAVAGPLPYGACVGIACGAAGASHSYRCAKETGII